MKTTDEIIIYANSLSKIYKLYNSKRDFIKEAFHPLRKLYHKKFHALKDISISLKKGEVLGIIGKNGSGKSTLLKILASIVTPSSGEYSCKGRVTALLELSGGFNRELTGIQNIIFLGGIYGFSRVEMTNKIKQILDFAEIGEYASQPIKSYSSGMYMRLAFSLAIHIEPDVLIVDEILAVGDARFKQKCLRKITEFKDDGKTIVLCSHSMETIKQFCTKAIWLNEGKIVEEGLPNSVTDHYNAFMVSHENTVFIDEISNKSVISSNNKETNKTPNKPTEIFWQDVSKLDSFGTGMNTIKYAGIININTTKNISTLKTNENIRILLHLAKTKMLKRPAIHLSLNNHLGIPVFKINSNIYKQPPRLNTNSETIISIDFIFPKIANGKYSFSLGILSLIDEREYIHWVNDALLIQVSNPDIRYKVGSQIVIDNVKIQTTIV